VIPNFTVIPSRQAGALFTALLPAGAWPGVGWSRRHGEHPAIITDSSLRRHERKHQLSGQGRCGMP
jgi:hypothetical protein